MTNRNPEVATFVTAQKLEAMVEAIEKCLVVFREASDFAKKNKGIASFGLKSGDAAVDRAQSFAKALEKAIYQAKVGDPYVVGELKSRSTGKTKTPKEAKEELQKSRKTKKKS
jgi:hypothetical protein